MRFTTVILGCIVLIHLGVQAQEVPNELIQLDEVAVNVTDSDEVNETLAMNITTELKPKTCNEMLQNVVDQSVNNVSSFLPLKYFIRKM